jgi:DNA adenine methylase
MCISPLRYPGGKSKIAPMVCELIKNFSPKINTYYEPFCGGAGVALYLLTNNLVEYIAINDFDRAIYSFWRAVFLDTDRLITMIENTPITVNEWKKQRNIFKNSSKYSVNYAFATLFLNRTNRSGIISAGPIGGYKQKGIWKIDARYNKTEIINRIITISKYKKRVKVNNMDIRRYIRNHNFDKKSFIFFDPPYVNNAKRLYKNAFVLKDHIEIAEAIKKINKANWIITYDDTELIRSLYSNYFTTRFSIQYSVASKKKESELLILGDSIMHNRVRRFLK